MSQFTIKELKDLIVLLNRVDIKGNEAFPLATLFNKIQMNIISLEKQIPLKRTTKKEVVNKELNSQIEDSSKK